MALRAHGVTSEERHSGIATCTAPEFSRSVNRKSRRVTDKASTGYRQIDRPLTDTDLVREFLLIAAASRNSMFRSNNDWLRTGHATGCGQKYIADLEFRP